MLPSVRSEMNVVALLASLIAICILVTFKIFDFDFWWHVHAGDLMRQTGWILETDPFSYAREGQPYLATHEWLAQIIFSIIYGAFGSTGIILLRWALTIATAVILLSIDWRNVWINCAVMLYGIAVMLPGLIDRPQLFTYLLFAGFLRLCLSYLDCVEHHQPTQRLLWNMAGLQLLWVNLHGAAAVMGCLLFGAVCMERISIERSSLLHAKRCEAFALIGMLLTLFVILLAGSPAGFGNATYLWSLLTDKTVIFIQEWVPRPWGAYFADLGLLWIAAIGTTLWTRKHMLFSLLTLASVGLLSRQSMRHEMLFALAAVGVTLWQLRWNLRWQQLLADLLQRRARLGIVIILLLIPLAVKLRQENTALKYFRDLYGFGTFEPAKGAADFLQRQNIRGPIFNEDWGGYLSYRGAPERKIFYDGRNVDFGYDFMRDMIGAAQDPALWQTLEDQYQFTHAVLYYDPYTDSAVFPYVGHLGKNPAWSLTYLDDWMAVYLKRTPENETVIAKTQYTLLTPELLEARQLPQQKDQDILARFEQELQRVIAEQPDTLKGRLSLATLYLRAQQYERAKAILDDTIALHPTRYAPYELQGLVYEKQGLYAEAGEAFEQAIEKAGPLAESFNYTHLADVFEKAGDTWTASVYRNKTQN